MYLYLTPEGFPLPLKFLLHSFLLSSDLSCSYICYLKGIHFVEQFFCCALLCCAFFVAHFFVAEIIVWEPFCTYIQNLKGFHHLWNIFEQLFQKKKIVIRIDLFLSIWINFNLTGVKWSLLVNNVM